MTRHSVRPRLRKDAVRAHAKYIHYDDDCESSIPNLVSLMAMDDLQGLNPSRLAPHIIQYIQNVRRIERV